MASSAQNTNPSPTVWATPTPSAKAAIFGDERGIESFGTGPRYRTGHINSFRLGGNHELIYCGSKGTARIVPGHVAGLLVSCRNFATLDEHAKEINERRILSEDGIESALQGLTSVTFRGALGGLMNRACDRARKLNRELATEAESFERIKLELRRLVAEGFLVSEDELLPVYDASSPAPDRAAPLRTIAILTKNKIECLERCLISYVRNSKAHGRKVDFVVGDDSDIPAARERTRRLLRSLALTHDIDIAYAGVEEKQRFAASLIRAGLPARVVNFALFGSGESTCTTGANRNALLLHTVGDQLFSVDDDTVCRVAQAPHAAQNLALDSSSQLMQFWFFPNREAALRMPTVDLDILSLHEQLLGKRLTDCLASFAHSNIHVDKCSPRFLANLKSCDPRVSVTFNGLFGDSAMQASPTNTPLDDASHLRLMRFLQEHDGADTREVYRSVVQPTITDNFWCMSTALGLDNRELLPPFMPVERNQDGLFGMVLRRCFERSLFAHMPWAILHHPQERRSPPHSDFWNKSRTCDVIAAAISSFDVGSGLADGKDKLKALGQNLMGMGKIRAADFEEIIRILLWRLQSAHVSSLHDHLAVHQDSSDRWVINFTNHLNVLKEALVNPDYFIPRPVADKRTRAAASELLQSLLFAFGELLYWWPEIVDVARGLRDAGEQLARPVAKA